MDALLLTVFLQSAVNINSANIFKREANNFQNVVAPFLGKSSCYILHHRTSIITQIS